jgi:glycopeptide antibiotics resistance protein
MKDLQEMMMLFSLIWVTIRGSKAIFIKRSSVKKEILTAVIPFSLVFIYFATVFPFPFFNPYRNIDMGVTIRHNFIPFTSIIESLNHFYYMVPIRNIGGNIILFAPFGFALTMRFTKTKVGYLIFSGLLVSLTVEICQLMMGYRSFDVDDLLLNTAGTSLGALTFKFIVRWRARKLFLS